MGSALIRTLRRRCNLPSGLPGGWTKFAWRSHPIRSEALSRASRGLHHFSLGSLLDAWGSPPLFSFAAPSRLSKPPTPLRAAWRCRVDRRSLQSPTGDARAPRASSLQPPPPVSLRSCPHGRLSSLHDVVGQSLNRRDPGCSERCLPVAYAKHLISLLGDVFLRISIP
jgi:hypothetical protein